MRFAHTVNGTTTIPDPLGRTGFSHLWRVEAEVTPFPQWAFLLSLPFVAKGRTLRVDTLTATDNAAGIGDVFFLLKRDISPAAWQSSWNIALGAGIKAPTGAFNRERNGVRLPRDLQPGTGTWEALGWAFLGFFPSESEFTLASSLLFRSPLQADELGYRNGIEFQALLSGTWITCPLPFLLPHGALRLRMTTADKLNGIPFSATGGYWLDALPALTLLAPPFALQLQGTIPLLRHTRGPQLVHSWGIAADISWSPLP